jgi:putative transposase
MAAANPLWGAPRIHGELAKLGVEISERTVSRLLRRPRQPPSQTWRTFLTNHVAALASIDFFTVPTITGRILFVFVVLTHDRRRIVHFNVTPHPTAAWTAQQMIDAFPDDSAPGWLLRDRDAIYGQAFRRRVVAMGIREVLSRPSSPWQNPYIERLIGSIRRECLDHVIVLGERHLRRMLAAYACDPQVFHSSWNSPRFPYAMTIPRKPACRVVARCRMRKHLSGSIVWRTAVRLLVDVVRFASIGFRSHSELAAENLFLRKQLALYRERQVTPRRADDATRIALVLLSRLIDWRAVLTIVKPDTLIRWHRKVFRLFWRWM